MKTIYPQKKYRLNIYIIAFVTFVLSFANTRTTLQCSEPISEKLTKGISQCNLNFGMHDITCSININKHPALPDSFISSNNHFNIHYTTEGKDAVALTDSNSNSIPDRIEKIADAFEKSYTVEIEELGYNPPPALFEGKIYDIYVIDLVVSYGRTVTLGVQDSTWEQKNVSSYILFDNDFSGVGYYFNNDSAIKTTAAHEFFHAIQLGYIFRRADHFFLEMSAVWMETQVFKEIDNYLYCLDYFFSSPEIPLNGVSVTVQNIIRHNYGSAIFCIYLEQKFGKNIIRDIWSSMPDREALDAISRVLINRGTTFESEFTKFSIWNYFTGSRSRPNLFYDNASKFPEIKIAKDTTINYYNGQIGNGYFLTASYYVYHASQNNTYIASITGEKPENWHLGVAHFDDTYIKTYYSKANQPITIPNVLKDQQIVIIPINVDRFTNPNNVYFKEKAEEFSFYLKRDNRPVPVTKNEFEIIAAYPNPFSKSIAFEIEKTENTATTLCVYNTLGQLIDRRDIPIDSDRILWSVSSLKKEQLPAGIYFFQFSCGDLKKMVKLVLCK